MRLFLTTYFIITSLIFNAQSIQGTYREKTPVGEGSHLITFEKNSFEERFTGDLQSTKGIGVYHIKNNYLVLDYKLYPNQDSSRYELTDFGKSPNLNIELSVYESDSTPIFAYFGFRDINNDVVSIIGTDKNGTGNITLFKTKNIGYFTVDAIGYHRISIPIKRLINKQTKIKAYLKPQVNIYKEVVIEIYKMVKFTNNQLILSRNGIIYTFEKLG